MENRPNVVQCLNSRIDIQNSFGISLDTGIDESERKRAFAGGSQNEFVPGNELCAIHNVPDCILCQNFHWEWGIVSLNQTRSLIQQNVQNFCPENGAKIRIFLKGSGFSARSFPSTALKNLPPKQNSGVP
ncbi:hypothetical protein, partial [Salmonella enterica]|uniref:hypothetical protein n=1 Tax=Salmonella enterica TaxID=28901 RepID=UPI003525757C